MIRWTTILALLLLAAPAAAQESMSEAEKAEMMETYMEAARPGPQHERLAALEGSWTTAITMWPAPGAEPVTAGGACENRMILGGRFLESACEGALYGMPVESVSILGFDRRGNEWTWLALDTMGTYWVAARGDRTVGDSIVMAGEDHDALFDYTQTWETVLEIEGPDRYVVGLVFSDPAHAPTGEPHKLVEVVHTRRE